jgi:hypothetical protein
MGAKSTMCTTKTHTHTHTHTHINNLHRKAHNCKTVPLFYLGGESLVSKFYRILKYTFVKCLWRRSTACEIFSQKIRAAAKEQKPERNTGYQFYSSQDIPSDRNTNMQRLCKQQKIEFILGYLYDIYLLF